jgi:signal transduction histidine kinase
MEAFSNLELLSVGIAIAGTALLGVIILISGPRSATNRAFSYFAGVTVCWSIVNYAYYQLPAGETALLILRLVVFFATLHAFTFLNFAMIFPKEKYHSSRWYRFVLLPLTIVISILTLTPYVFKNINAVSGTGSISGVVNGPAIPFFGLYVLSVISSGIFILARKSWKAEKSQRKPYKMLLIGIVLTFLLLLGFNFFIPAIFNNPEFIPFGALFLLPFVIASGLSILRYRLFNIKVAAVGVLSFFLSIVAFINIVYAKSLSQTLFTSGEFILILLFSFWLIRGVLREVQQREHIEKLAKELESANVRLKELDQLKNEFLSVASHQLRAPITAIRGYVANVLDGSYGALPDYLKDPLGVVQESTRVMVSSIEDYLNVSRIEQGKMKYELSAVDVTAVAKRATDELVPLAQAKGLMLTFAESPSVTITADFGKIKQVFTNLIDNAIKYTQKGSVTVSITQDDKVVRFMTSDTGIGIPSDEIGHLFEKFTRARDANQVNTTGTGLGLYVAKSLVEGQGGTIHIESDGVGKGSRFIVELPLVSTISTDSPLKSS